MTAVDIVSTRERILERAASLFYAEGIRAVGVDRIVADSGVAKSTLYQHFGSKDELVAAYLRRRSDLWRRGLGEPAVDRRGSSANRVNGLFGLLAKGLADPAYRGCPFINAAAEYPGPDGPVAAAIAGHRAELRDVFHALLDDRTPVRRAELVEQLVLLYDGAMVGAYLDDGAPAALRAGKAAARLLAAARVRR